MVRSIAAVVLFISVCHAGGMDRVLDFSLDDLDFYAREGYMRLVYPGCQSLSEPGEPLLPVKTVVLVVPAGAGDIGVTVDCHDLSLFAARQTVQPCAVPRPFSASRDREIIVPDPLIYGSASLWPAARVSDLHTGTKSGYTLVSFSAAPVRYDPVGGMLELAGSIDIHLTWADGSAPALSGDQIRSGARQLSGWIDNPEDLMAFAPHRSNEAASVDMLVITSDDFSDSFSMLVDYKNSQGIVTELVDIEDILSAGSGWDDAEKLRNYLIDRFDNDGLQHVLLGGDQSIVPVRMVNLYCEGYSDCVPVDLYFSDLDGTWDANGDHDYGQPEDGLDLYSDVSVGRALVDSPSEAALFVERTLDYQQSPPGGAWSSTAMLCGAGLFTGYTGAKVCDSIAVNLPADWTVYKAYETAKNSDGFTTHIDVINDGANWVHYAGHGNTGGIYWQGYPSSMMTNSIASSLTNGGMAGVHHSIACMPGAFHDGECCAEALWHNPGGGASSVMFNTSYGWEGYIPEMGVSEWMCVYLTEEVFQLGNTMIGEAFATAKDRRVPMWGGDYDRELYCILDWHGFHDPTMRILGSTTGIAGSPGCNPLSESVVIGQPRPNPSSVSVSFQVDLPSLSGVLEVYDISGRLVWSQASVEPGVVRWDFDDSVHSGVYFAVMRCGGRSDSARFVISR
ncbi:MAG: T9SS type A sorting domain-containing protein [Candidatus Fermentibacteraceae bacterium]|nr:T9SS type A sorting domain-containing protein [Candidatus Fermentibacteraceae bacterium]MBN2609883.1 T9SS type A sorting domain-containing protein [Candidatus Fermentibacteraceae bacterium]